jgi:DNA-binding NarL/FixJ family response regulator
MNAPVRVMRVLIADDNQPVRRAIAGLLSGADDLEVCGQASDASETLQKASELNPDLILLDVSMPGSNGLDTARLLKHRVPHAKILIISHHDPDLLLSLSLEVGAHGCLDKGRLATDLLPTVKRLLEA